MYHQVEVRCVSCGMQQFTSKQRCINCDQNLFVEEELNSTQSLEFREVFKPGYLMKRVSSDFMKSGKSRGVGLA